MTTFFRAPGARIEHLLVEGTLMTRCGRDARLGARFTAAERGQDAKLRPLCTRCRDRL